MVKTRPIFLARVVLAVVFAGATIAVAAQTAAPPDQRDHWSFQPVRRPEPAAVKNTAWPRTGVDAFILARLEREGLSPSPETDRLSWLRRAYFTVTGLPPTPEQVTAFVNDTRADAYERVVDE